MNEEMNEEIPSESSAEPLADILRTLDAYAKGDPRFLHVQRALIDVVQDHQMALSAIRAHLALVQANAEANERTAADLRRQISDAQDALAIAEHRLTLTTERG